MSRTLRSRRADRSGTTAEAPPPQAAVSPTAPAAASRGRGLQTFRSLHYRDFRLLWLGILGASAGNWIEQTAVAWVVLERTDSPTMVGVVQGARALPSLVMSPLGGVIADRFDRRRMLIVSQISAAALAVIMAVLDLTDVLRTWHIMALVLGFGIVWALNNPVRHSFIPQLVPRSDLMNAVALNSAGFNISRSIGPFIGAFLLGGLGFGYTYAIAAGLYGIALYFTFRIRSQPGPGAGSRESLVENLRDGLRYVRQDRLVLSLLFLALIPVTIGLPYITLVPVIARDVLHRTEVSYGVMLAFTGIGSLAGTLALASTANHNRGGVILLVVIGLFGASLVFFALAESFSLALVALFFTGMFSMIYLSMSNTLIQMTVDDRVRGRVMSIMNMEFGLSPLAAVAAAAVAEATSPGKTVMGLGIGLMVCMAGAAALLGNIRRLGVSKPRS